MAAPKKDYWEQIFAVKNFDLSKDHHVISLPFRRGLLAACWTAFLAVVSDVAGWEVDDAGALATGSARELRAPRLKTGCWLGHPHHSPFGFRTFALAAAACFARAVRSSDVMVSGLRLPPMGPPRFPPARPTGWG